MSFRLKTILGIAFIEALLLLALVIMSLAYLRESNQEELQRRATLAATLLATATNDAVLSTDLARLEQLASDFLKNPGVVYVRIADRDRLLVQTGDAKVLQRPFRADSTLDLVDDNVFDTFAIIKAAGQDYGRIELGLSITSIQAVIKEARQLTVGLALLEMVLVALFSLLLGNYLTRQLRDLENASNRIALGNFNAHLPVRGKDELARVAKAFNSMSTRMGNIYQALQLALSESRQKGERLQAIVDSQLDGLIAIDRKGAITLFSHSAEQIFGYAADEVLGRNVSVLMPEPYRSHHDNYMHSYLYTGDRRAIGVVREVQGRRKDGSIFPVDLAISELKSVDQMGFLGLVRDITERKLMLNQLQTSESMKKAMLESSLDAIITIDENSCICEFNHSATAIFGYELDEVLGQSMTTLLIPERYRNAHEQGLAHYLATGEANVFGRRIEITALHRLGHEFPVELAITPINQAGSHYFTAFLRDISETKAAEDALRQGREQAEQASRVKSQFLAMMSHEIRTPLTAILGTQEMLAETALDDIQKTHLQLGREASTSLLSLINDILDLTKVEAGKLELENTVFDARQTIADVVQLVEAKAKAKNLLLMSLIEPDVNAWISGDPWRLRQILLNLMTNAIKFTHQGMITVKLSMCPQATDGVLLFEVTDTGIGIAEHIQPKLFELFIQADPSDTRKYGGSGLGLAISKRLVELCGGKMGLDSRAGIGSHFWFSFGNAAEAPDLSLLPEATAITADENPPPPAQLLLVEDSPTNQAVLLSMLRGGGHRVDVANSGSSAIATVEANPHYDLIFMDVSMPDMDGMEATRRIRALGGAATQIPIIAMTAHAVKGYKELCLSAGMNGYATKPISKANLLALVGQWRGHSAPAAASAPVAAAPIENTRVLLDENVLLNMAQEAGMDNVVKFLHIFMDEIVTRRAAIQAAIIQQDLTVLGREAHTLKSGAATFGAIALYEAALAMDLCRRKADIAAALVAAEQLLPCVETTLTVLAAFCEQHANG
ncbi:MAG: PAS domain S-box protein [Methylococcaceae bacterium]|nr:PAS domain S-box protein [Methylococcaceae bacterium]